MLQKTVCVNGELRSGDLVISTADDDYAFLIGRVLEIRLLGSDEHETENSEDDVYVDFLAEEYTSGRIREIEAVFSRLYGMPKLFEDLPLDCAIMGPSMLIRITDIGEAELQVLLASEKDASAFCSRIAGEADRS